METGELIIGGTGELHLQICLSDLVNEFAQVKILKQDPIVTYRETVKKKSNISLAKSQNKLNRIFTSCEPLDDKFIEEIENKNVDVIDTP